jgi:hypothetical protein
MKNTILCLLALALVGCGGDFNTPGKLDQARVLAIQAEPPQPSLGSSTTLRPLLYLPEGETASYSWSWCPLPTSSTDVFACHIDQGGADALFAQLGVSNAPPLNLGAGDTISFANPFPPTTLAMLCSSKNGTAIPFACTGTGLPVTVQMVAHTSQGDLAAITYLYLPADSTLPPNQNPVASGLTVGDPPQALDALGSLELPRDSHVPLAVVMDPSAAEKLPNPGPGEKPYERVTLSWYAEGGDFGYQGHGGQRTGTLGDAVDASSSFTDALANTWNTPTSAAYPGHTARIVVVIRDSRGGVSWISGLVSLEPRP